MIFRAEVLAVPTVATIPHIEVSYWNE
jgi:hypothetical protein